MQNWPLNSVSGKRKTKQNKIPASIKDRRKEKKQITSTQIIPQTKVRVFIKVS